MINELKSVLKQNEEVSLVELEERLPHIKSNTLWLNLLKLSDMVEISTTDYQPKNIFIRLKEVVEN